MEKKLLTANEIADLALERLRSGDVPPAWLDEIIREEFKRIYKSEDVKAA